MKEIFMKHFEQISVITARTVKTDHWKTKAVYLGGGSFSSGPVACNNAATSPPIHTVACNSPKYAELEAVVAICVRGPGPPPRNISLVSFLVLGKVC